MKKLVFSVVLFTLAAWQPARATCANGFTIYLSGQLPDITFTSGVPQTIHFNPWYASFLSDSYSCGIFARSTTLGVGMVCFHPGSAKDSREAAAERVAEAMTRALRGVDGSTRLLVENAAKRIDAGLRADVEAGMAKLFCSETALEAATESMRIHGGYGYTTEFPVERYYRDAAALLLGPRDAAGERRRLAARWLASQLP